MSYPDVRATDSVHPRAGGERPLAEYFLIGTIGSSPRGRGTLQRAQDVKGVRRFIPARAGNAGSCEPAGASWPVHPRAGGERPISGACGAPIIGSSPRGRGTREASPRLGEFQRFIPARAGNADLGGHPGRRQSVHPRAGGERFPPRRDRRSRPGSSPRGRGTPAKSTCPAASRRFIPARAGNARERSTPTHPLPVHPRAGGERSADSADCRSAAGSSPRGRGTLPPPDPVQLSLRFIPARAGNANAMAERSTRRSVHPRAGGNAAGFLVTKSGIPVHPRAGGNAHASPHQQG